MNYNYHTHTYRCRHASGTEEEYILRAIENGIEHLGFSDHIPFRFPDGHESHYRVPTAEAEDYIASLRALREKYAGKIEIVIGFETEYYPSHFEKMVDSARKLGAEYLILGQHFIREEYPNGQHSARKTEDESELAEYCDCVVSGIESGLITLAAHPDLFAFVGSNDIYRREMTRVIQASIKHEVPLEINFLGIRDGRFYPHEEFWQLAAEMHAPVTFGFDAHDVPAAYDGASLKIAMTMVERLGLNYIGRPKLRPII